MSSLSKIGGNCTFIIHFIRVFDVVRKMQAEYSFLFWYICNDYYNEVACHEVYLEPEGAIHQVAYMICRTAVSSSWRACGFRTGIPTNSVDDLLVSNQLACIIEI